MESLGESFIALFSYSRPLWKYGFLWKRKDIRLLSENEDIGENLVRSREFSDIFNRENDLPGYPCFNRRSLPPRYFKGKTFTIDEPTLPVV